MVSLLSLILFFLYKAYYLKFLTRFSIVSIVKRRATVVTHFWVIPQIHFFFLKNKNLKNKIEAGDVKKAG
jgi:hypothetical protein